MTEKQRIHASDLIVSFIDETCGSYDWGDFITTRQKDPDYQLVCDYCNSTQRLYPTKQGWCSDLGCQMLKQLVELLRSQDTFEQIRAFIASEYTSASQDAATLRKFDTPPIP